MKTHFINKIVLGLILAVGSAQATDLNDGENFAPGFNFAYDSQGDVVPPMMKSFNFTTAAGEEEYDTYCQAYEQYSALQPSGPEPIDFFDGSFDDFINLGNESANARSQQEEQTPPAPSPQTAIGQAAAHVIGPRVVTSIGSWLGYTYENNERKN
ncbi:MAG: hypothetical protein ACK5O7_02245 [Holosporales bacterium]